MKSAVLVSVILLTFAMLGNSQEPTVKYSDIKAQAVKVDKPILIEFSAVWAPTCRDFEAAVQSDSSIGKALEPVVLYQADVEKGDGISLAKEFKVKAYPSFIIVNAKGEPLDRWLGYDKDNFVSILDSALKDKSTISQMEERLEKSPSVDDAAALGRWYLAYGNCKKATKYYQKAQELNSDPEDDYSYEIFLSIACGSLRGEYTFEEV